MRSHRMQVVARLLALAALATACLALTSCSGNVGVGINVGVPVGDHGYMSVGTGRWF